MNYDSDITRRDNDLNFGFPEGNSCSRTLSISRTFPLVAVWSHLVTMAWPIFSLLLLSCDNLSWLPDKVLIWNLWSHGRWKMPAQHKVSEKIGSKLKITINYIINRICVAKKQEIRYSKFWFSSCVINNESMKHHLPLTISTPWHCLFSPTYLKFLKKCFHLKCIHEVFLCHSFCEYQHHTLSMPQHHFTGLPSELSCLGNFQCHWPFTWMILINVQNVIQHK